MHMRSFVKIKLSQNGVITIMFTDIGNSCLSPEILASQIIICLLMLFAKIKFSRKFLNLQYFIGQNLDQHCFQIKIYSDLKRQ